MSAIPWKRLLSLLALPCCAAFGAPIPAGGPFIDGQFEGRIAWSADGNHNDPDDWIASPMALAILAESGLKDRLVHFDYNSILPLTNVGWEKIHAESVLGAAERYGYDKSRFIDCRKDLDRAIAGIADAINASSTENPLYFVIAGPMEVPYLGIQKADPSRLKFVYAISHSRWNDGFATSYNFKYSKRPVIEQGVHWVQIPDQNRLLSFGRYGRPSTPGEFKPYFWMRDSEHPAVHFLWERMLVSTRPDPSDAGMMYFVVTGDEACDPAKLERLVARHQRAAPVGARNRVRLEAENFRHLENFVVEDRNDKKASHRLNVLLRESPGRISTAFDEPYTKRSAVYKATIRYWVEAGESVRMTLLVGGRDCEEARDSPGTGQWTDQSFSNINITSGDEIGVWVEGANCRLDFVELETGVGQ